MEFDVVCIGSSVRDFFLMSRLFRVVNDPHFITGEAQCFAFGTKVNIDNYQVESGGGGHNAAITFARQGLKVALISKVGNDPSGKELIAQLEKEKVNTKFIVIDKKVKTASSFILMGDKGERTILTYRGASGDFRDLDVPLSRIKTKWLYVSSLNGNIKLLEKIVRFADLKKIKIAVNPGIAELEVGVRRLAHILANSDVFIVNRLEASQLTGVDKDSKNQVSHALCLLTRGIGVVTDGENGAIACNGKNYYQVGVQQVKAIDATGAGDAFGSGLVAGLIRFGGFIEPSLQLASNNSSSVVSYMGAKRGILKKGGLKPYTKEPKIKVSVI